MRNVQILSVLLIMTLGCGSSAWANGSGGSRYSSAQSGANKNPAGAWYKIRSPETDRPLDDEIIRFDDSGEFVDYKARLVAGRWMTLDGKTLRIGSTTLGFGSPADPVLGSTASILCRYSIGTVRVMTDPRAVDKAKVDPIGKGRIGDKTKERLMIESCVFADGIGNTPYEKLEGTYERLKLVPGSPVVGKWFNARSGSLIEFTRDGDYIVQGVRTTIVWQEQERYSPVVQYRLRVDEIAPEERADDGTVTRRLTWRETPFDRTEKEQLRPVYKSGVVQDKVVVSPVSGRKCLAEVILERADDLTIRNELMVQDTKLVDRDRREFSIKGRLYDSLSLVALPGSWMISDDGREGVMGISRGGLGRPVTGLCRYMLAKDRSELELSECSDPVDGLPPDKIVLTAVTKPKRALASLERCRY